MSTVAKLKTVAGVTISKVDPETLAEAFAVLGQTPPGDLVKSVEGLVAFFKSGLKPGDSILECDNCGGGSTEAFEACPFCGDAGDEEDEEPEAEKAAVLEVTAKPKKSTGPRGPVAEKSTALVPAQSTEMTHPTKALDDALDRVRTARNAGAAALWAMSVELRRIYDDSLWKLRVDDKGKPVYKGFSKFLATEVDLHERTVYRMIEVTKQFDESKAEKYGASILRGLLAAPKEDRTEILAKIDAGEVKGKRGVEREVQEIRKRKGVQAVAGAGGKNPKTKAATKASASKSGTKSTVTVPFPVGRQKLIANALPLKKSDPEKQAMTVEDRPWGKLECANGVTVYVAIVRDATGGLMFTIEAKRDG